MRAEIEGLRVSYNTERIINEMVNLDRRNIFICGDKGELKSKLLQHVIFMCEGYRNVIEGDYTGKDLEARIRSVTEHDVFYADKGIKSTLMIDNFHKIPKYHRFLLRNYRNVYSNYIISILDSKVTEQIPKEVIKLLDPVIIRIRRYTNGEIGIDIRDRGRIINRGSAVKEKRFL